MTEPAHDYSSSVASHVLERSATAPGQERALRFAPRAGWVGGLLFGSWGAVIALPLTIFLFEMESPPLRSVVVMLVMMAVGYGLLYAAARSILNRAQLEVDGVELRFSFAPLWPHRARRWRLADVQSTSVRLRPASFWHPAKHRGYPLPQPYLVDLAFAGGGSVTLPIALARADAEALRDFVGRHR